MWQIITDQKIRHTRMCCFSILLLRQLSPCCTTATERLSAVLGHETPDHKDLCVELLAGGNYSTIVSLLLRIFQLRCASVDYCDGFFATFSKFVTFYFLCYSNTRNEKTPVVRRIHESETARNTTST